MLSIIKFVGWIMVAFLFPFFLGMLVTNISTVKDNDVAKNILAGYMLEWTIIQFLVIPAIFQKVKLSVFSNIIYCVFALLIIASIYVNRKRIAGLIRNIKQILEHLPIGFWVIVTLVILQSLYIAKAYTADADDATYVAMAQTALDTDSLMEYHPYTGNYYTLAHATRQILSPFPIYVALMAKLFGTGAAMMAHTMLPTVFIPLAYMVWYMVARVLYGKDKNKKFLFMMFIMVILMYSGYSVYTPGMFMFGRIWQGKAVLTSILLPFLLCQGIKMCQGKFQKDDWFLLFLTMFSTCFVSSMGFMLGPIMLGSIVIADTFVNRRFMYWKNVVLCCMPNIIYILMYLKIKK